MHAPATPTFVPATLDCGDFAQLEPLYQQLLARPLDSAPALAQWLADWSELSAYVSEFGSRRQIEHACHTEDAEIEKRYLHYVEQIRPRLQPLDFQLTRRMLDCPHIAELTDPKFAVLRRQSQAEVEIYRDANIPLQTEATKQSSEYGKLCGKMIVDFRGEQLTLQQLARFLEEPDRSTREEAWRLSANRRLEDRQRFDSIFDELLKLRGQIARHADLPSYRDYVWKSFCRFDYTPQDCARFADSIAELVTPAVAQLNQQQQAALGVDRLRPWDLAVDPQGRAPLRPFPADQPLEMVAKVREIFRRIDPQLAELFGQLQPGKNLDLESRRGKRPGGFQSSLEVVREPFIFMNAAGVQRDVETLLHEAGHAFHYQDSRAEPLVFLRHAPLEFAEVASMSMELLGCEHYEVFYNAQDATRARRQQLEGIIRFFPWMATIDSFQHWLYTHADADAQQRTEAWLDIYSRFFCTSVDWTGLEDFRASRWQAQLHVFNYPFYYIEYGIAQLGALQVWQNYRQDRAGALRQLRSAFALGGTRPLPELFAAAGIRFDFSAATLGPLIEELNKELATMPA